MIFSCKKVIIIFLTLYSGNLICQSDSSKTKILYNIGFNFYRETLEPFSFKKEDNSQFIYNRGFNFYFSVSKYLNKNFKGEFLMGYGWFKRTSIPKDNGYTKYKSNYAPMLLQGSYRIVVTKKHQIGLIGGLGYHFLMFNEFPPISTSIKTNQFHFTYLYGLLITTTMIKSMRFGISPIITHFNGTKFFTAQISIPLNIWR